MYGRASSVACLLARSSPPRTCWSFHCAHDSLIWFHRSPSSVRVHALCTKSRLCPGTWEDVRRTARSARCARRSAGQRHTRTFEHVPQRSGLGGRIQHLLASFRHVLVIAPHHLVNRRPGRRRLVPHGRARVRADASYRACGFWACSSCSPECRRASCRRGALELARKSLRGGMTSLLVRAALGVAAAAGARVWPDRGESLARRAGARVWPDVAA